MLGIVVSLMDFNFWLCASDLSYVGYIVLAYIAHVVCVLSIGNMWLICSVM